MSTIVDLITDRGVVTSVASASALAGGASIAGRRSGRPVPVSLVAFGAMGAAVAVATTTTGLDWSAYLGLPTAGRWWTIAIIAAVVIAVWFAAGGAGAEPVGHEAEFMILLAAAAAGVFLAVPETDLLRLIPGPMAVATAVAVTRLAAPFGRVAAFVLAAGLGWLAVIDGQTRPAAIVGAAGCLAVVALCGAAMSTRTAPRPHARRPGLPSPHLVVGVIGIAVCSRGAGILRSTATATVIVVAVLAAVATLMAGLARPTRSTSTHSTNPEGSR